MAGQDRPRGDVSGSGHEHDRHDGQGLAQVALPGTQPALPARARRDGAETVLYLEHLGRTSGTIRNTVLEVVDHDEAAGSYHVAAGFGPESHWYRNLEQNPDVTIQVGRRRMSARSILLSPEKSGEMMVIYAQRYPKASRRIMSVVGLETDGTDESYREIGRTKVPFVRFEPRG